MYTPPSQVILFQTYSSSISEVYSGGKELFSLTLLHSEWPKLNWVLAILSATGLRLAGIQSSMGAIPVDKDSLPLKKSRQNFRALPKRKI